MNPREKFNALLNPKNLDSYGLTLTEEEMRTFPEGREFLLEIAKHRRSTRKVTRTAIALGKAASRATDQIALSVLLGKDK